MRRATPPLLLTMVSIVCLAVSYPINSRIIGGKPVEPGEFPYQVSIQYWDRSLVRWVPICGGLILNPLTIMSAAHCTLVDQAGLYRIVAGEHDLMVDEGNEQFRIVDQIVIHHDFDEFFYHNDIALFFISAPLVFNDFVKALALPPSDYKPQGLGTVAGWGSSEESVFGLIPSMKTSVLNKVDLPFLEDEKCSETYSDAYVESMMLCAGVLTGGQDACAGDSGGGLVSSDHQGRKVAAGLVSFGEGCGKAGYPGVYTRVSNYVDWVYYVIDYVLLGQKKKR